MEIRAYVKRDCCYGLASYKFNDLWWSLLYVHLIENKTEYSHSLWSPAWWGFCLLPSFPVALLLSTNKWHTHLQKQVIASSETLYVLFPQPEMLFSLMFSWLTPSHHLDLSSNFNFFWKFFSNHTCACPFLSHYSVVFSMDHNLRLFVYLLSVIATATAMWNLQG